MAWRESVAGRQITKFVCFLQVPRSKNYHKLVDLIEMPTNNDAMISAP
jgi:hypothetical protein